MTMDCDLINLEAGGEREREREREKDDERAAKIGEKGEGVAKELKR